MSLNPTALRRNHGLTGVYPGFLHSLDQYMPPFLRTCCRRHALSAIEDVSKYSARGWSESDFRPETKHAPAAVISAMRADSTVEHRASGHW